MHTLRYTELVVGVCFSFLPPLPTPPHPQGNETLKVSFGASWRLSQVNTLKINTERNTHTHTFKKKKNCRVCFSQAKALFCKAERPLFCTLEWEQLPPWTSANWSTSHRSFDAFNAHTRRVTETRRYSNRVGGLVGCGEGWKGRGLRGCQPIQPRRFTLVP